MLVTDDLPLSGATNADLLVHHRGMELQSGLRVHRRATGATGPRSGLRGVGEAIGAARLLAPQLAQVEPPLDELLNRVPHKGEDLVVLAGDEKRPRVIEVIRLRPCLVDYDEACRLAAQHRADGLFLPSTTGMVALELCEPLAIGAPTHLEIGSMNLDQLGASWLCKIFCVTSCKSC